MTSCSCDSSTTSFVQFMHDLTKAVGKKLGMPHLVVFQGDRSYCFQTGRVEFTTHQMLHPFSSRNPHARHWKAKRGGR